MARTQEGRYLTDRQRLRQMGIRSATIRDIIRLWPMWDPDDPASYERFVEAVITLTQARSRDSAALAARYYEMFRDAELPGGVHMTMGRAAVLAEPASPQQIRVSIDATARATVYRSLGAGYSRQRAMQEGLVRLTGSIGRHVLNGGRDTIIGSAQHDARCLGWARVTDGDPCPFCAMLASRGPVYKEDTVLKTFAGRKYHDFCGCTAEPVYEGSEWPGRGREFQSMWNEVTRGFSGQDAVAAWRKALTATE